MAINDAMKFIRTTQKDKELRQTIYKIEPERFFPELAELGYSFTMNEFEESVNMLHVKCQSKEEADQLMQTSMWFKMIVS